MKLNQQVQNIYIIFVYWQELDKQWRICTETLIRGKSVRGYRTNNRKWTENKFKVALKMIFSITI